jgi:UDP-N-acetylmuramyl pentapeptide phosphotransferase/UDP-N-acetylglucosamine-1-phosphate transferase
MGGFLTTLGLSFIMGDRFMALARSYFRAPARPWTPARHKAKDNLPTMGGIFMVLLVVINTIL